jgi:hypothetical protein
MGQTEAKVDLKVDHRIRRVTLIYQGQVTAELMTEAQEMFSTALSQLGEGPFTALTLFIDFGLFDQEAAKVFGSMMNSAGQHDCKRAARVIIGAKSPKSLQSQMSRLGNKIQGLYEAEWFDNVNDAETFLDAV